MSLSRLLMRLSAARALKGATLAEGRVFDSAIDPLSFVRDGPALPAIVVTTDDHEMTTDLRDFRDGGQTCELVIEVVIASAVRVPASDGQGGTVQVEIPHTDEGQELLLDIAEAQVKAALTDGATTWSAVWMQMVPKVHRLASRRGASADDGVRYAARQLVYGCDLVGEPVRGEALPTGGAWANALAALDADSNLAPIANVVRAEIAGDTTTLRQIANMLGVSGETAGRLGVGGLVDGEDPNPLVEVGAIDDGGEITITEGEADEQGV